MLCSNFIAYLWGGLLWFGKSFNIRTYWGLEYFPNSRILIDITDEKIKTKNLCSFLGLFLTKVISWCNVDIAALASASFVSYFQSYKKHPYPSLFDLYILIPIQVSWSLYLHVSDLYIFMSLIFMSSCRFVPSFCSRYLVVLEFCAWLSDLTMCLCVRDCVCTPARCFCLWPWTWNMSCS